MGHRTDRVELCGRPGVPRIGFGAMRLTGQPGNFGPYPDPDGAVALLREAVELGVRHVDTARSYGPGHNEELVGAALRPFAADVVIATKVGVEKTGPDGSRPAGRPDQLRDQVLESLTALRADVLDLVYLHRPDPDVPLEESVGTLAGLRHEGAIREVGLSNVDSDQVEAARHVVDIAAVQNRYSLQDRSHDTLVDRLAAQGIWFVPYGPLGGDPWRRGAGEVSQAVRRASARQGVEPQQVLLAWLLHRAPVVLPVPGTTRSSHLRSNLAAATLRLDEADLADLADAAGSDT